MCGIAPQDFSGDFTPLFIGYHEIAQFVCLFFVKFDLDFLTRVTTWNCSWASTAFKASIFASGCPALIY